MNHCFPTSVEIFSGALAVAVGLAMAVVLFLVVFFCSVLVRFDVKEKYKQFSVD